MLLIQLRYSSRFSRESFVFMARAGKNRDRNKNQRPSSKSSQNDSADVNRKTLLTSIAVPLLLIAIAILGVYSNALSGPFIFDDELSIEKNNSIRTLWPLSSSLWAAQDTPTAGRPVVNLTFALNYAFGRQDVAGYHLLNVVLHILNAFLLYGLIDRSMKIAPWRESANTLSGSLPFFVVLLWAVHPLQTETVNYVTQRTELLMAFFLLLSTLSSRLAWDATSYRSRLIWQGVCVASCALGMASKEVMVVAPVMVVLYDIAVMNQPVSSLWKSRGRFYMSLASTWIVLALLLATNPRGRSVGFGLSIGFWDYVTTQCWAITHYLWLAIWPVNLCGDYGVSSVTDIRIWLPRLLLIVAILCITFWAWFRWRVLSFLGLWFFMILAPTTSVIPIVTEPIAERRMYLSLAAFILLIVAGISHFSRRWSHGSAARIESQVGQVQDGRRWKLAMVFLVMAGGAARMSHARNEVYQTELSYWMDVVQKKPLNARGYQNLGKVFLEARQIELAKEHYQRAKELAPSDADSHYNLGVWHLNHGDPDEAIANFDRALLIRPDKFEAAYNRAFLLSRLGRFDESIIGYKNAIHISPKAAIAHLNLGNVFFSIDRLDEAIEMYEATLRLNPKLSEAYQNLGAVLARKGECLLAIGWLEKAVKIAPDKPDVYNNLGFCYGALGQSDKAISAYLKCVSIQPSDADAWNSLGKVYADRGEKAPARRCFEQVLQLQPDAIEAQNALQQLGTH